MMGSELVLAEIIRQSADGRAEIFTANGTFKVPPGINTVFVTAIAAGNNGAAGGKGSTGIDNMGGYGGCGGDGGNAGQKVTDLAVKVTPNASISVTVGTGNTVFGSYFTLIKGAGQMGGKGGSPGENGTESGGWLRVTIGATDYADMWGTGAKGYDSESSVQCGAPGSKGGKGAGGLFSGFISGGEGGNGGNGAYDKSATAGNNGAAVSFDYGAGGGGGGGGGGGCSENYGTNYMTGGAGGAGGAGRPGILIVRW